MELEVVRPDWGYQMLVGTELRSDIAKSLKGVVAGSIMAS